MNSNTTYTTKKSALLKSYSKISQIETHIKQICNTNIEDIQISVLHKSEDNLKNPVFSELWKNLTQNCINPFILSSKFGIVANPEVGNIAISGFLTPMFLQEINGKNIGEMATGIYGILKGLNIDYNSINFCLKTLKQNHYLLIVRGAESDLIKINKLNLIK